MKLEHMSWCGRLTRLVLVFGVTTTITSCTIQSENPDKLLELSITGLSGKDRFTFVGQSSVMHSGVLLSSTPVYEGRLEGHTKLYVKSADPGAGQKGKGIGMFSPTPVLYKKNKDNRWVAASDKQAAGLPEQWNPLAVMEHLNQTRKQVTIDRRQSNAKVTVLNIIPEQGEVKQRIQSELKRQFTAYDLAKRETEINESKLSSREKKQLLQKVRAAYTMEKTKFTEMLKTLQVQSHYTLVLDRRNHLPREFLIQDELSYTDRGAKQTEENMSRYEFSNFDPSF
ncbi:hypothetical protein [Paenibacillus gansuensis]|uniref:Lipoprotein n=1 Tax=Paenibacillus gansuensis TaxID=306542 RepID=A0ABW5PEJ8_9BACL